ncbi:MAG: methylmalonyl-CoA mutase family protein, partial [Bacteroidetes bacterium]|nr:methylmalonyl-CoA mutase family protein [Bacteroidota bacterium]
ARTSDPYQALIPGTTGAIAAVLGEPDSICILSPPLPLESGGSTESRRLARNILLLLRHEAYLSSVRDPLSGSYYIEKLTDLLAERAWELFVQIEEGGGLSSALANNLIETWIETDREGSASRNKGPART